MSDLPIQRGTQENDRMAKLARPLEETIRELARTRCRGTNMKEALERVVSTLAHPYHIALESAGHKLVRDEDGDVDIFRLDAGSCNGPECELCGKKWCHHCHSDVQPCKTSQLLGLLTKLLKRRDKLDAELECVMDQIHGIDAQLKGRIPHSPTVSNRC